MEGLDPISRWAHTVYWEPWIAIGTIGAVASALWIAGAAHREARERDRATLLAVLGMATKLRTIYTWVAEEVGNTGLVAPVHMDTFEDTRALVERVSAIELPTRASAEAFIELVAVLQLSARMHAEMKRNSLGLGGFARHCAEAGQAVDEIISVLEQEATSIVRPHLFSRSRSVPDTLFHHRRS